MKKIPTLFVMENISDHERMATSQVTPGMEWVLEGEGTATIKFDGAACAVILGKLYKRYDAKPGKTPPEGSIPCQPEPDPVTGHWPHWAPVRKDNPSDKWFIEAFETTYPYEWYEKWATWTTYKGERDFDQCLPVSHWPDGTYEAVGKHFQGNPYHLSEDILVPHGRSRLLWGQTDYENIRLLMQYLNHEGLVFWKDGEPKCKIRRRDFGFEWPIKEKRNED